MALSKVWTEREEGDWEACVTTAYSMALLYGGVKMAAPYTKAQRELLEVIADAPQTLNQTDTKSLQVYGVKLRGATPGLTIPQALGRPGIGLCLTTNNSPGGFGTGFIHEVFWVGQSATTGLLYDPLAPEGSAPQTRTVAYMVPWIRGVADHQIREVREWEFGPPPPTETKMAIRPVREDFTTGAGPTGGQFYTEGPGVGSPKYFTVATRVESIGETTDGLWRVLFYWGSNPTGGEYLWMARSKLTPIAGTRNPAVGFAKDLPEADCSVQDSEIAKLKAALVVATDKLEESVAETQRLDGLIHNYNVADEALAAEG